MESTHALTVNCELKTRSSKSQAILLAANYGGKNFKKAIKVLHNGMRKSDSEAKFAGTQ